MTLVIHRPGLLTTVQDLGRFGFGAFGIPPSGAMDTLALRIGNRLVGNADDAAGLEFTLSGPEIELERDAWIALVGARFETHLDGHEAPERESFLVRRGQVLSVGRALDGARGVLAVGGGIEVPRVLGSRATLLAAGFGGLEGRALRGGDRLAFGEHTKGRRRRIARPALLAADASEQPLRVVGGPQQEAFSPAGRSVFYSSLYSVSTRSDRMGIRLEGPSIERAKSADLPPEGIAPGSIQVPADGLPIVLGVDRPTTGGYTKIATVVTVDLGRLAQAKPGDRLRFAEVSVDEARRLWREREELLRSAIAEVS